MMGLRALRIDFTASQSLQRGPLQQQMGLQIHPGEAAHMQLRIARQLICDIAYAHKRERDRERERETERERERKRERVKI